MPRPRKRTNANTIVVFARMSREKHDILEAIAARMGMTRSALVTYLTLRGLEDLERQLATKN